MKAHLFALTALFFLLTATSCQKKPTASFSTDKEVYTSRDEVVVTNSSSDAAFYTWIVKGPGQELRGSDEHFSFLLKEPGTYEIFLAVYSKNGKDVSKVSKTINVQTAVSSYVFYTSDLDNLLKNVSVYVDNQYKGVITANCYNTPTCGTPNTLSVEIPDGVHDLRFTFGPINHNKVYYDVTFSNGRACIPYLIIS